MDNESFSWLKLVEVVVLGIGLGTIAVTCRRAPIAPQVTVQPQIHVPAPVVHVVHQQAQPPANPPANPPAQQQ